MSQFSLENDMRNALRMDAPITRGPQMRWQCKLNQSNASRNESMINCSLNGSMNTSKSAMSKALTPKKSLNRSMASKTPGKTPTSKGQNGSNSKTPGKGKSTPGRGNKTPTTAGDRFIPNRGTTQFELGHHLLSGAAEEVGGDPTMSPSKRDHQRAMSENLNGEALSSKIISYKNKAPNAPEGHLSNLKVLYSQGKTPGSCRKTTRHIPQVPERILDAPEILDDYYLNLLDWSCHNHLAVCLGGHVYLWNATSGDIQQLMEMESSEEYVSSVAWVKEGNYLAIGTSANTVQLWDVEQQKRLRTMTGHAARIGAMTWNEHILSSGSRSGFIHHHDVRVAEHLVGKLGGHTQEVCGLQWSPDGRYLASGGNDNVLNLWSNQMATTADTQPLYAFTQHQAAVKALAWCPWQPSLLASGGGTADRNIRFWNCNTGQLMHSVDTQSQVCSILWSKEHKELISGHGFAQNQLIIWKYPTMAKVAELTGHTSRVLHLAMSPDGSTVVSAAADETLRLWKCFATDPAKKKATGKPVSSSQSMLRGNIR